MDLTEETVDDLVNQWWFTNPNANANTFMNDAPNGNEEVAILSSANSPLVNSPLSSTSLENNFEGLCEFPFFSSTEALQSPRSPRYDGIAIAAPPSQEDSNTPPTDTASMDSVPVKQEPPVSPLLPPVPVVQTRGPGRPRKNAASLGVDTVHADADHTSKRKRHSQIERRYRCRLQAGMDSLGEVLPMSRSCNRDRDGADSPTAAAAAAGPRSRKASILIDAREYILELEADKRLLAAENNSLKAEIARMKRQRVKETSYYAS